MAISIFDENQNQFSVEFEPYDDSRTSYINRQITPNISASSDRTSTSDIDQYRQGVSITTEAHRFKGMMAKLWAGNVKSYTKVTTIGQPLSWVETKNDSRFIDQQEFDSVSYMLDEFYPPPFVFNDGPQGIKVAKIRAYVFPLWNEGNGDYEGTSPSEMAMRGNLSEGNQDPTKLFGSNNRFSSIITIGEVNKTVPFLDEGQAYYGNIPDEIMIEGYLNEGDFVIDPFDDNESTNLTDQISTNDASFITILRTTSSINLDDDIRPKYGTKSATTGYDVYGPSQATYGVDSIAYSGMFRGS